ncbi:TRAP transporter large permease subunit [candidate division KSB1 bacterium]|nr:TRAP transporter large permease subunit [candidate division KSB1 bacterium]
MNPGLVLLVMIAALAGAVFILRWPTGISLAVSALAGALSGGFGIPLRHLVEGTMLYLDPILIVVTSLFFMRVYEQSGSLADLNRWLLRTFGGSPALLIAVLTLFVMFPGMLTGLTAPCVLTTGAMCVPILLAAGLSRVRAGAFIAVAAFFGMVAPPVNICAMIIGGGVDMPYVGFGLPLTVAAFPLAFASSFWLMRGHITPLAVAARTRLTGSSGSVRWPAFLPLFFLLLLLLGARWLPAQIPDLGVPLLFVLAAFVAAISGARVNLLKSLEWSVREAVPILALLAGIGMFIQVLTLTGARGEIVVNLLVIPHWLRDLTMAILVPLFGGVSAYGSSSVLGVPLLLAMLERSDIVVAAALSLLASIGDFLPPTRLAVVLADQVTQAQRPGGILKHCWIPALAAVVWALLMIWFANPLARLFGLS